MRKPNDSQYLHDEQTSLYLQKTIKQPGAAFAALFHRGVNFLSMGVKKLCGGVNDLREWCKQNRRGGVVFLPQGCKFYQNILLNT